MMSDEERSAESWENEGGRYRKSNWPTAKTYESKNAKGGNGMAIAVGSGNTVAVDHKNRLVNISKKRKGQKVLGISRFFGRVRSHGRSPDVRSNLIIDIKI